MLGYGWFNYYYYIIKEWLEICLRLQAIHMYKYTKLQGPRFQRNYIIARDQKSDLHDMSLQSSLKINHISTSQDHLHTMKVYKTRPSQFC